MMFYDHDFSALLGSQRPPPAVAAPSSPPEDADATGASTSPSACSSLDDSGLGGGGGGSATSLAASIASISTNLLGNRPPSSPPPPPPSFPLAPPSTAATSASATCVRINGRKVFGPPPDWCGPPPPIAAELFVKRIPRSMDEQHLHALFRRFGAIYCVRLMVDFNDDMRGFGYVHYTTLESAERAMYVLQHCYVQPHIRMHLERSYDKCRLFVSHLPKHLRVNSVRIGLHEAFPEVQNVVVYHSIGGGGGGGGSGGGGSAGTGNRGFAFMDFATHDAAIRAKQQASTGRVRLFGQDVQIVWANPERATLSADQLRDVRTLFVRNVDIELRQSDLMQIIGRFVPVEEVRKVSRIRDLAFVELRTREAAERVLERLNGYIGLRRAFDVQWSIPPNVDSLHGNLKPVDHDATLRLLCIANEWMVPIYLFGRIFTQNMSQYVCIMLATAASCQSGRNMNAGSGGGGAGGNYGGQCALFMEVRLTGADLQSRAAEVAVSLVQRCGRLPLVNYVVVVEPDCYHIVGCITDLNAVHFLRAGPILPPSRPPSPLSPSSHPYPPSTICHPISLCWSELYALSQCAARLQLVSRHQLRLGYDSVLRQMQQLTAASAATATAIGYGYLPELMVHGRLFGCLNPGYRRQPPLRYDVDCGQLVLVACDANTGRNYNFGGPMESFTLYDPTGGGGAGAGAMTSPLRYERVALAESYATMVTLWQMPQQHPQQQQRRMAENFVVFFGPPPPPPPMAAK